MGRSLAKLAKGEISNKAIFNNRLVIEIAENVHVHYRNLRIELKLHDFLEVCRAFITAKERWEKQGCPKPGKNVHIELCRRKVAHDAVNKGLQINLNDNLYNKNEGKIFAEGADFLEKRYIHFKMRDLRIEMPIDECREVADAFTEADCYLNTLLQEGRIHEEVPQSP